MSQLYNLRHWQSGTQIIRRQAETVHQYARSKSTHSKCNNSVFIKLLNISLSKEKMDILLGCYAAHIGRHRRFGTTYRPHFQVSSSSRSTKKCKVTFRKAWKFCNQLICFMRTSVDKEKSSQLLSIKTVYSSCRYHLASRFSDISQYTTPNSCCHQLFMLCD
jgi:hypothetical protein